VREALINEEALLFAGFLRDERKTWIPGTPNFDFFLLSRISFLFSSSALDEF